MEVQELDQQASEVNQLWRRLQNEAALLPDSGAVGRQNGRMDDDDLGPETDVDSVDDVLLSPSIAAAKAAVPQAEAPANESVWPHERLHKEQQMWLKTLPWSYADAVRKNPPKKQLILEDVNKVGDNNEHGVGVLDHDVEIQQQPEISASPVAIPEQKPEQVIQQLDEEQVLQDPTVVIAKGEEIKNYVGDNDIDSGEESEEEWNYIPGKENPKENLNQIQQIQKELNAEDEEDMESQLNPNAAEFVPVFIPPNSAAVLEKDVSSSPAKGAEQSLENIDVPSVNEFYCEISKRPSELESLNNDPNQTLNETTLNGMDITGISTKAEYGGDDSTTFMSSVNSSTVANPADDEDEAIEVQLNDTNPFSPTHVPDQPNAEKPDTIQEQMVQDHFSLGFKPFDPMTQSMTMMEDEGQHEDETSPDIDFMSSDKPDLLSPEINQLPVAAGEAHEALEAQTSSSGFDSESGPDDVDHIPAEQCNLAAAAATVGISFGEDIDIEGIVNTKSISLIDDSHPIEKIEQTISPSESPMPTPIEVEVKEDLTTHKEDQEQEEKLKNEEKSLPPTDDILIPLKGSEPTVEPEIVQILASSVDTQVEAKENISEKEIVMNTEEEIVVTGMSPKQLQFNQEQSMLINKNKEEEPESDSGFEIINASEASNDPDLIANETSNKLSQNVEESLLVNGLVSNCVPDILLQPSETALDRQPSPIGIRTDNIIADIEGAMLDSSPPMIHSVVEDSFTEVEKVQEPTEVPLVSNENEITEQRIEENKPLLSFDSPLVETKPTLLGDRELEESKTSFLIDHGVEEESKSLFDTTPVETKPSLFGNKGSEDSNTPLLVDYGLEVKESPLIPDQDKGTREIYLSKSPVPEEKDVPLKVDEYREDLLDKEEIKEVQGLQENKEVQDTQEIKEVQDSHDIKEVQFTQKITETQQNIQESEEAPASTVTAVEEKKLVEEIMKDVVSPPMTEQLNKHIEGQAIIESNDVITQHLSINKQDVEVPKETVQEIEEFRKEVFVDIQNDSKEKLEQLQQVSDIKEETKEVKDIFDVKEIKEQESLPIASEQKELKEIVVEDVTKVESPSVDEDKEQLVSQPTPPTTPAPGVTEEDNKQEFIAAAIAAAGVAAGVGLATAATAASTPKVDEKAPAVVKKPTAASTVPAKKPEVAKSSVSKSPATTRGPASKPGATSSAASKKVSAVGPVPKAPSKPTSTAKPATPSSKPSTPTSKTSSASRPTSAKPSTPISKTPVSTVQAKTPPKPRTPTTTKPLTTTSLSTAAKAPAATARTTTTTKTTVSATAARPSSAGAPKKSEPAPIKRAAPSTTATKPIASATKTAAAAKTASVGATKPTTKPATTTSTTRQSLTKSAATTAVLKTSTTTTSSARSPTKTVGNSLSATAKPSATKTTLSKTTTAKTATTNSTATKTAPITKTKPAAPTAIKKPSSADKNIKDATNNKLSAAKQTTGAINKKQEVKTNQKTSKIDEPLTQEPTITTTNGHIENGISNEESSPVEIATFPQIVQALN